MPTYSFINENGEDHSLFMTINELDEYLRNNPNLKQCVSAPAIISGRGMGKPDDAFRDILRNIKKENSKGINASTVNTF